MIAPGKTKFQMLLFHHARLGQDAQVARHQERARIACAERFEDAQLFTERERDRFGWQFGINIDCGHEVFVRSEEHTSELSHVEISYAVFCLKKKKKKI